MRAQQPVTLTLTNSTAQTVTVTTTETHVAGVKASFSQKYAAGALFAKAETSWSVELNYSYTHTATDSRSDTKTVSLAISETVNAPPQTAYRGTLTVALGRLPPTVYKTTAKRWYDQPVTGGEIDNNCNGWYRRTEPVSVTIDGCLSSSITVDIEAKPLS